ncbi:MAG: biliverdin-producing heme oxygenase [Planctomycetia bacterium]|nr:MAG: biliverdin-producing heme oxygenase [Planctomycetia bacterium]
MTSIMDSLRTLTAEHHRRAEQQPLEQALARGVLPKDVYINMLEQRYCAHRVLDRNVADLCDRDIRLNGLVHGELLQWERLEADLLHFGVRAVDVEPLAATAALCADLGTAATDQPAALLGYYYVTEGSKNGAAFLAPRVRAAYGLSGDDGTRYMNPHGPRQRELWAAFRDRMNAVPFSATEREHIITAAQRMFDAISETDAALFDGAAVG